MAFRIKCEFFNLFTYSDTQPVGMERRQQLLCAKYQLGDFYIPKGTDTLSVGDIVVVVGMKDKIAKFDQFLNAIV